MLAAFLVVMLFASCGQKEMVVVGYTIYEPMNYEDESGKLVGFDTELAEAVFEKLGYTVSFKRIDWNNKYMEPLTVSGTALRRIPPMMTALPEVKRLIFPTIIC